MCLGVVADDVTRMQLELGAGGEVALLLADREERRVHVQAVEHAHELLGVGAGTVVERERELVALTAAACYRGRVGEHGVDRLFFGLVHLRLLFGRCQVRRGRGARAGVRLGTIPTVTAAAVRADRRDQQREDRQ